MITIYISVHDIRALKANFPLVTIKHAKQIICYASFSKVKFSEHKLYVEYLM